MFVRIVATSFRVVFLSDPLLLTHLLALSLCVFFSLSLSVSLSVAVVTHYPPILPTHGGLTKEGGTDIIRAVHRSGTMLHISGHCHWAHGLYHSSTQRVPFVVASVCDSKWERMTSLEGVRGDRKWDMLRGGYNVKFVPFVVDLPVPKPTADDTWVLR